ncbi:NAD(P)/FAD-dependent oxidoreductase [Teichococcus vastitatis]|uniref:FAD-binding oxidoreductase n=1 Tax=Teichococcus vastitatis TaxID=2307076 RepID=A0ABS9W2E6_9PROT|nr:FAD-dependent oxidoreductase [Pseudoroseomonas vastitatis]MCI0753470.1 FAD-binding oxidoreductase [Pseudoroseomonas vastitatis]
MPATTQQPDCLVVGSGIAGVCAALFIQKTGARVAIVDPNAPGTGASFGNAGIVVNTKTRPVFAGLTARSLFSMLRDPASPLNVRWSQFLGLSPWFMRMLSNANPADVQRITAALSVLCRSGEETYAALWREAGMSDLVRARGSLALNLTEAERDRDWDGPLAAYRAAGVPMEKVDAAQMRELAPVGPRYAAGVYSPDFQHTTSPEAFVARLFKSFLAQGGTQIRTEVEGVATEGGRVTGLRTRIGLMPGGSVVLAAGTGTAKLAQVMGEAVPHQAVGGYHVMLGKPGMVLETPLLPLDFRFAITPMRDGIRLAGTYEFGGAATAPVRSKIDDMLRHITAVLPGVDATPSSTWRGFRSYLPDALPVISDSRKARGLYYMFGFSSSGMINGAAAGRALAQLWHGETPGIDMAPYAIDRFQRRFSSKATAP